MDANIASKITAIKDEVGELHPILTILFKKLDGVVRVDYTHGANEFGADFVITRDHQQLHVEEYIGVIVKTTSIAMDFTDVERQLKECIEVPRSILNGKRKAVLNEVWVVTTKTISANAKEKIHSYYEKTNVLFIDGNNLAVLFEKYFPDYWTHHIPLQTNEYLITTRSKNRQMDINLSLAPGDDYFYIEQTLVAYIPQRYRFQKRPKGKVAPISIYNEIDLHNMLIIEGGMGFGKSKLLRHIIDFYAAPENFEKRKIIPVFFEFKIFYDVYKCDVIKCCKTVIDENKIELGDSTVLLVLDSFDEKALKTEEQIKILSKIYDQIGSHERIKVIITTRTFDGLDSEQKELSQVRKLSVKELSLDRTIEFIRRLFKKFNIADRFVEDMKKSCLLKEMPKTPIAAILLAQILQENAQDLPSNLPELFNKYIELVLGRWDIKKGLQSQKEYEAMRNILSSIATHMIDNEQARLTIDEAHKFFDDYLDKRQLGITSEKLFDKLAERCDITMVNKTSNIFAFKHRSFMEFLYALRKFEYKSFQIDNRAFLIYWSNIYYFYLGIKKDCKDELLKIAGLSTNNAMDRLSKVYVLANYMLAGYATEYSIITRILSGAMIDAARLYVDIVSNKALNIDPFLVKLPQMSLLCLMQYIIRNAYAFTFLESALADAAVDIDNDKSVDPRVRAYALFFLVVTKMSLAEVPDKDSFEFILEKYKDHLQFDLELGIMHESKSIKGERAKHLRHLDRHISKYVQTLTAKQEINKLYDLPIEKILKLNSKSPVAVK